VGRIILDSLLAWQNQDKQRYSIDSESMESILEQKLQKTYEEEKGSPIIVVWYYRFASTGSSRDVLMANQWNRYGNE